MKFKKKVVECIWCGDWWGGTKAIETTFLKTRNKIKQVKEDKMLLGWGSIKLQGKGVSVATSYTVLNVTKAAKSQIGFLHHQTTP